MYINGKKVKEIYRGSQKIKSIFKGSIQKFGKSMGDLVNVEGNPLILPDVKVEERVKNFEIQGRTEQKSGYLKNFNQLSMKTSWQVTSATLQDDGSYYVTSGSTNNRIQCMLTSNSTYKNTFIEDHKYMMLLRCKNVDSKNILKQPYNISYTTLDDIRNATTDWGTSGIYMASMVAQSTTTLLQFYRDYSAPTPCYFYCYEPKFFDLTEMYGAGKEPLTIAAFEQDNPNWWLEEYCAGELRETSIATTNVFPNPEYPKEIVNVQAIEIVNSGKNLWKPIFVNKAPNTTEICDGGNVKVSGYYANYYVYNLNPNEKYTISFSEIIQNKDGFGGGIYVLSYDENNNYSVIYSVGATSTKLFHVLSIPNNSKRIRISFYGHASSVAADHNYSTTYKNVQIERGSTATDYEPPRTIHTVSIDGIELTKWDKIVKRNGVWGISKNSKIVEQNVFQNFNVYGAGNIVQYENKEFVCFSYNLCVSGRYSFGNNNINEENSTLISENFKTIALSNVLTGYNCGISTHSAYQYRSYIYLSISKKSLGVAENEGSRNVLVNAFKNYVSNNPITIVFRTEEEQSFTPLSDTVQQQLNQLQTYIPNTVISNGSNCEMSMDYFTDLDELVTILNDQYENDLGEINE